MGRKKQNPDTGVFHFSSTRAFFDKAIRERERFHSSISVTDKIDNFLNFAWSAVAAVDQYKRDLKRHERASSKKLVNLPGAFDQTTVELLRLISNRFKHGDDSEDPIGAALAVARSAEIDSPDQTIDLTTPHLANFPDADVVALHLADRSVIKSETLLLRLKDGTECRVSDLIETAINEMNFVFSQVYKARL